MLGTMKIQRGRKKTYCRKLRIFMKTFSEFSQCAIMIIKFIVYYKENGSRERNRGFFFFFFAGKGMEKKKQKWTFNGNGFKVQGYMAGQSWHDGNLHCTWFLWII